MYISESSFAVRSSDAAEMVSITSMLFQNSSSTAMDAHIVQTYIASMDMLYRVSDQSDVIAHYSDPSRDWYSRLSTRASREELLKYWQNVVTATFDVERGIITVEVKAYSPEMAQEINAVILECSEDLVNRMNDRTHQDALRITQAEVAAAEQRLFNARADLRRFRDDKSILDPSITAQGLEGLVANLETEASRTQAELNALLGVMQPNSPSVKTVERRLDALNEQIAMEKSRIAGMQNEDGALSSLVGDYAHLVTEEEFAQELLLTSMTSYEAARLKAISQSRYIVPVQPPTLPDESLYPKPFAFTLFIFFGLLIILGLCSLVIAAVKDHMGV